MNEKEKNSYYRWFCAWLFVFGVASVLLDTSAPMIYYGMVGILDYLTRM